MVDASGDSMNGIIHFLSYGQSKSHFLKYNVVSAFVFFKFHLENILNVFSYYTLMLLGVTIGRKLIFEKHIQQIFAKASAK